VNKLSEKEKELVERRHIGERGFPVTKQSPFYYVLLLERPIMLTSGNNAQVSAYFFSRVKKQRLLSFNKDRVPQTKSVLLV